MSSRVQKGGQKFKPVAKPRGRPGEGTPTASRKPLSARGTTLEALRSQFLLPNEGQTQTTRLSSVSLAAGSSVPEQRDGSLLTHKPNSSTSHDGQTNKLVSSKSTGGSSHSIRDKATLSNHDGTPTPSNAIPDMTIRPPTPIVPPSRSQPVPITRPSFATPIVQRSTPTPSQIPPKPEPTLYSLLHRVSPNGNTAIEPPETSRSRSQVTPTDSQDDAVPELDGIGIERQAESTTAPDDPGALERVPSQKQRNLRNRSEETRVESDMDDADAAGEGSQAVENRMNRKRRASTYSEKTSQGVEANAQAQGSSEKTPRRTKRTRRSTTRQPAADYQLDTVSGAEGSESETQGREKRRQRSTTVSSSSARGRRSRNPSSSVIFDPDAGPGEELDPTVVTMAAICDDTGQGRVSSKAALIQRNHLAWKTANKEKRERMRAVMESKKYGRKEDEDGAQGESSVKEAEPDENESQAAGSSGTPAVEDASGSGFNYRESLAINRFSAQVRIGPNGETIIDEESLFVDRTENADDGTDAYQHIEESDQTKFTNSATYGRKLRGSRWSAEETELFYDALSQFGENYELISYVLPGRDRKSCKSKFKSEDKKNPNRITYCLNNRIPYDIQTLSRLTGKDFSGPTPEIIAPEIIAPEIPTLVEGPQEEHLEHEQTTRKTRKRSKTPAVSDDVEVVGDVETFDIGGSDE